MRRPDDQIVHGRRQPIAPIYRVVYIDNMRVDKVASHRNVMLVAGQQGDNKMEVSGFRISTAEQGTAAFDQLLRRRKIKLAHDTWQYQVLLGT